MTSNAEGILAVNKPRGLNSFALVRMLRRHLGVKKIGHAGTLDPFADGVMIMLIGRNYTKLSDQFLNDHKEYEATILLGVETDTFDCDGQTVNESDITPSLEELEQQLEQFQGEIEQVPPMFSAKKINGKKLYELARKGETVERAPVKLNVHTTLIDYNYPHVKFHVRCSKGTYIRSIAHDLGQKLGCGGHLVSLTRTKSGTINIDQCLDGSLLSSPTLDINTLKEQLITR